MYFKYFAFNFLIFIAWTLISSTIIFLQHKKLSYRRETVLQRLAVVIQGHQVRSIQLFCQ